MLLEERLEEITRLVNEKGSITNQELMRLLDVSESTIRRDITALAADNKIVRAHGGAISVNSGPAGSEDLEVSTRRNEYRDEKMKIGREAAKLINNNDLVYIDAGTTTEYMIDFISSTGAVFVTNSVGHAISLAKRKLNVYIIGGQIKSVTEAIVDSEAIISLSKYNFTKGFFGTNGVSEERGLTTPDIREANVKSFAMGRCMMRYVLCDSSKFNKISKATFADSDGLVIITDKKPDGFEGYRIAQA